MSNDELKAICIKLDLKPTKKNLILVRRIIDRVGMDIKKIRLALKKALLGS
ncbi:MAG: hypothetical protein ACTSWN_00770 [Promethearchaeota archaeon]